MEIVYEIIENFKMSETTYGRGCYTSCEEHNNYGADYWCCERIKNA